MSNLPFSKKLALFVNGTKLQRPRPIVAKFDEGHFAAAIEAEVVRQFSQARVEKRMRFDLRKRLRELAKETLAGMGAQILAARPKKRPDGKPTGGSLSRGLQKALSVKRSGFTLKAGKAGLRVTVTGIREAEERLAQVALERLKAMTSGTQVLRELQDLARLVKNVEQLTRQRREAARRA